ncbi:MAG: hypothetical protein GY715_05400 [Planctomycetes bacterium]|nr:hypothetical protein [Planctomycetota bacterium]
MLVTALEFRRMQCNIDARGRAARLAGGIIALVAGIVLAALRGLDVLPGVWPWIVAAALMAFGAFGIFEARAGWCALRAMGFKTRL